MLFKWFSLCSAWYLLFGNIVSSFLKGNGNSQWPETILVILFVKFRKFLSFQKIIKSQLCFVLWLEMTNLSSKKSLLCIFSENFLYASILYSRFDLKWWFAKLFECISLTAILLHVIVCKTIVCKILLQNLQIGVILAILRQEVEISHFEECKKTCEKFWKNFIYSFCANATFLFCLWLFKFLISLRLSHMLMFQRQMIFLEKHF